MVATFTTIDTGFQRTSQILLGFKGVEPVSQILLGFKGVEPVSQIFQGFKGGATTVTSFPTWFTEFATSVTGFTTMFTEITTSITGFERIFTENGSNFGAGVESSATSQVLGGKTQLSRAMSQKTRGILVQSCN